MLKEKESIKPTQLADRSIYINTINNVLICIKSTRKYVKISKYELSIKK